MIFTKRSSPQINLFVKLKEHNILPFSSMRFLGNVLDPKLSDKKHMECNMQRETSDLYALRNTWWGANPNLLLSIYRFIIRASFKYASLIFALNNNQALINLQRV